MDDYTEIAGRTDETYANIPREITFQRDELARRLPEFGELLKPHKGPGSQYQDARPFRPGVDDPRMINHKMSARRGEPIFMEMQAEHRQPHFFWRKGTGTMTIRYAEDRPTKKELLDIAFGAAAKNLAATDNLVGVLDSRGLYNGTAGGNKIINHFLNANVITGSSPTVGQALPFGSTVILGSDFLADADERKSLVESIAQLSGMGLNGRVCMVLDPVEIDFSAFEGHIRFTNPENGRQYTSEESSALRHEFNQKMNNYIDEARNMAHSNGFKFILHRTDEPPIDLILKIFDDPTFAPGMRPAF